MDDLVLVGVHDDGEHLLLAGGNGQRYRLRVDEALRAAVRRDRARLGQIQIETDGRMRPREIQARIRAGETAEEIADSAGIAIEHVRRYEGPVIAEREFIALQAQEIRLRRTAATTAGSGSAGSGAGSPSGGAGQGRAGTLGTVVAERLAQREVDGEDAQWDAWRSEDGTWVVALDFTAGSRRRQARWSYDPSVRHVAPLDDEARWLSDDEPPAAPAPVTHRRLAPVRDHVYDVEAGGIARPVPPDSPAVDLLDTLRERRGRRSRPISPEEEISTVPDPVREAIDSLLNRAESMGDPPAAHPARSRPHDARDGEVLVLPEAEPLPRQAPPEDRRDSHDGHDDAADDDGDPVGARPARRAGKSKPRRASVPSWDDIVFGQRRD